MNFISTIQGDRFGGALDGAARQFSEAFDKGLLPMEFVNDMRKKGQLIMGIGHRVKSVSGQHEQQIIAAFRLTILKQQIRGRNILIALATISSLPFHNVVLINKISSLAGKNVHAIKIEHKKNLKNQICNLLCSLNIMPD